MNIYIKLTLERLMISPGRHRRMDQANKLGEARNSNATWSYLVLPMTSFARQQSTGPRHAMRQRDRAETASRPKTTQSSSSSRISFHLVARLEMLFASSCLSW